MGHRLDDDLLRSPTIDARLKAEADDGPFFAWLERSNGEVLEYIKGPEPRSDYKMFAMDIMRALNAKIPNGGAWIVQWSDPVPAEAIILTGAEYRRFVIVWIDGDGDPQFTIEWDDSFKEALAAGLNPWLERGASAWDQWRHYMREVLAPRPDQLFKKAKGEKAPSLLH